MLSAPTVPRRGPQFPSHCAPHSGLFVRAADCALDGTCLTLGPAPGWAGASGYSVASVWASSGPALVLHADPSAQGSLGTRLSG